MLFPELLLDTCLFTLCRVARSRADTCGPTQVLDAEEDQVLDAAKVRDPVRTRGLKLKPGMIIHYKDEVRALMVVRTGCTVGEAR